MQPTGRAVLFVNIALRVGLVLVGLGSGLALGSELVFTPRIQLSVSRLAYAP